MDQAHHAWLLKWQREVQEEYERLHDRARKDPQYAGHGAEATWVKLLEEWLPPAYEVGTRKYILPEEGDDVFETDIVVFNPGYPKPLRAKEEVLAGGVAAAFSVKLTLNADGIRDAIDRAARLRRSMKVRQGTPQDEMLGPFAFGLLAHSHAWKAPNSQPHKVVKDNFYKYDLELSRHPRETLDMACIADLASMATMRTPFIPAEFLDHLAKYGEDVKPGRALMAMSMSNETQELGPVASFIAHLIVRLAQTDLTLRAFADSLRLTGTLGSGSGYQRHFKPQDIFTEHLSLVLPSKSFGDGSWSGTFF